MTIHIVARHIKLTKAIKQYAEEKVAKIKHYFDHIIWVQVILTVEKKVHRSEIVLHAGKQTFRAQAEGKDLYSVIISSVEKMEAQVKKYKAKITKVQRRKTSAKLLKESPLKEEKLTFSVVKHVPVEPMTADFAASEMERLGYNFWLFLDESTNQINVIFKRQDNSYGLMQPVTEK